MVTGAVSLPPTHKNQQAAFGLVKRWNQIGGICRRNAQLANIHGVAKAGETDRLTLSAVKRNGRRQDGI
jgi:hypothetical protein